MTRINTNISSLTAQTRLQRTNNELQTSLTRLSTGLRINSGKDDPAGLIASESLRSDITSLNKALSNTQRAGQIIATADSALGQVSSLLNDIRGLVTEAANSGALSDEEIAANQLQVDSSLEAINRIAQTTTFQGRKLLDGSLDFITKAGAGNGFTTTVTDLQIDQANLGSTGNVSVSVSVTSAATRASITNSGIASSTPAAKATGSLTFGTDAATVDTTLDIALDKAFVIGAEATKNVSLANAFTPNASAKAIAVSLAGGDIKFDIAAVDQKLADGKIGNFTTVKFATSTNGTASSGSYDVGTNTLTLTIEQGVNQAAILTALNANAGLDDFDFSNGAGAALSTAAAGIGLVTGLFGGVAGLGSDTLSAGATAFKLTAVNGGVADGAIGNATTVEFTSGVANGAVYNETENKILVTVAAGATISDIATKINTDLSGKFTATDVVNGTYKYSATDNGTNAGAFASGTNTTTAASIRLTAKNGGPAGGSVGKNTTFKFQSTDNPDDTTSTAAYDAATNTLTVKVGKGNTISQVAAAIELNDVFIVDETQITNGTAKFFRATDANGGDFESLTGSVIGTAGSEYDGKITITSKLNDTAFNKSITFNKVNSIGLNNATATVDGSGNIIVNVSDTGSVDLTKIASAINTLADYTATYTAGTGSQGNQKFDAVNDSNPTVLALTGGTQGGGLVSDLAFNLSGARGSQEFQFDKGASLQNVVDAINSSKDATGVVATIDLGVLKLESSLYGSKAAVAVEVISEGTGGTFRGGLSGTRAVGTDIVASVNGYAATGDGNTLALNTSTLNLKLTLTAGSLTAVNFDITGGGALFQLGGDVVSNQQARLGIGSLSTAKLGGVSGRLFELQGGRAKSLTKDITGAANVIDEVINKVTGIRGRLGAFQRTTLESNSVSLTDTLTNLSEAQSSIRDADFAKESANLTRAQILVQSGTSVLGIANQSSQSVLSLLR